MAHGEFGAKGQPSWQLMHAEIDSLVEFRKGWKAQLNYLDRSQAGMAELARQGLTPTRDQRRRWAGKGNPTRANQEAIQRAYTGLRRRNVIRTLTRRLEAGGGTRVEIHPESQADVNPDNQRVLTVRDFNVRHWYALIRAWALGDTTAFQTEWALHLQNLGSDWRAYLWAASVGIQAS